MLTKKHLYKYVVAAACSLALLSACGSSGDSGQPTAGFDTTSRVTVFDTAAFESMDPAHGTNNSGFALTALYAVYDRLIHLAPDGALVPGLALTWSFVDDDFTVLELKLRPNVTFHDGQPVNADAVRANIERSKNLGTEANFTMAAAVRQVSQIEVVDNLNVRLHLTARNPGFPYSLAVQAGMMISPAAIAAKPGIGTEPVGAGPYAVKEYVSQNRMVGTRYGAYWDDKVQTRPKELAIHYVPDSQTRLNAVRSGQADMVIIEPSQLREAESSGLQVQVNNKNSVWNIYTNLAGPLRDIKVRQAFMHAVDRRALAEALSFGTGAPTQQMFLPTDPVYIKEFDNLYPYDPAKAKSLLAEAGHPNGVTLDVQVANTREYQQLNQALQAMVADSGFTLKFNVIDISQAGLFREGKGGDIYPGRMVPRPDPLLQLQEIVGPRSGFTPGGTASRKLEELLAEAQKFDLADPRRIEAIRAANRESTEQAAVFPLFTRSNVYAFKKGCIQNFDTVINSGADDLRYVALSSGCKS